MSIIRPGFHYTDDELRLACLLRTSNIYSTRYQKALLDYVCLLCSHHMRCGNCVSNVMYLLAFLQAKKKLQIRSFGSSMEHEPVSDRGGIQCELGAQTRIHVTDYAV